MNPELAPLLKLGRAQRLQLVEDLWDSIAREPVETAVSGHKAVELRQRKARFSEHPGSGRTWDEVKERARAGHD